MDRLWYKFIHIKIYIFFTFNNINLKDLDEYEMRPEDTCLHEKMITGISKL